MNRYCKPPWERDPSSGVYWGEECSEGWFWCEETGRLAEWLPDAIPPQLELYTVLYATIPTINQPCSPIGED